MNMRSLPSFDLTKFDLTKLDPRRVDLPNIDLPNVDLGRVGHQLTETAKRGAYAAVGIGVLATERVGKLADDTRARLEDLVPQLRGVARTVRNQVGDLLQRV